MKKFSVFLFSIGICASAYSTDWSYKGRNGPDNWADLDSDYHPCRSGMRQSPIDIEPNEVAGLPSIDFNYSGFVPKIINKGQTLEVQADRDDLNIAVGDHVYDFLQFHFHAPSEYYIEGKQYPLEVHFVHQRRSDDALGVVGVMFEEGEPNPEIAKILAHVPKKKGKKWLRSLEIELTNMLPENKKYFRFMGSLTTPPCGEGVNWYFMQEPITVSQEQIDQFRAIFPDDTARPLQKVNGRMVIAGSE